MGKKVIKVLSDKALEIRRLKDAERRRRKKGRFTELIDKAIKAQTETVHVAEPENIHNFQYHRPVWTEPKRAFPSKRLDDVLQPIVDQCIDEIFVILEAWVRRTTIK
jgi:hypothetical protein